MGEKRRERGEEEGEIDTIPTDSLREDARIECRSRIRVATS